MEVSPQHEQDLMRLPDEKKWQLVLKDVMACAAAWRALALI